jgi:hypothetical protein
MNEAEKRNVRELQGYLAERVAAATEAGEIAPQLLSYIHGDSREAIDASIALAKRTSAEIVQRVQQEQARPSDVDPAWQANQREGLGDQQPMTAEAIAQLDMASYARLRGQLGTQPQTMLDFLGGGAR